MSEQVIDAKLGAEYQQRILEACGLIGAIPHVHRDTVIIAREAGKLEELIEKSPVAAALYGVWRELNRVYGGVS